MATSYYKLPTVDPDSTLSFPDAVNGLANATDAVLHGIQSGFDAGSKYELPVASEQTLGGIRVGSGFRVYSDGLLDSAADRFELRPATANAIGGVYTGKNVNVTNAGAISVGTGAFADVEVTSERLANGAVTTAKLADSAVNEKKLDGGLLNALTAPQAAWDNALSSAVKVVDAANGSCGFYMLKLSDNVRMFMPTDSHYGSYWRTTFLYYARNAGKTSDLYIGSAQVAPGQLGSGTLSIGYAPAQNTLASNNFILGAVIDLTNARITFPESNNQIADFEPLSADSGILGCKVYPAVQILN